MTGIYLVFFALWKSREESREFDVHACEVSINIKFLDFSYGSCSGHTPKYDLLYGKYQRTVTFGTEAVGTGVI